MPKLDAEYWSYVVDHLSDHDLQELQALIADVTYRSENSEFRIKGDALVELCFGNVN